MAESSAKTVDVHSTTTEIDNGPVLGQPQEQMEIEETPRSDEEDIVYPTGIKFWLAMASLIVTQFLNGLDVAILAVAVPSLTNQFNTVADIGWYSAAYGVIGAAFIFLSVTLSLIGFGKLYSVVPIKPLFLTSFTIFELGSLICAVAPTSSVFILGRAIAGLGSFGTGGGMFSIMAKYNPVQRRPFWASIIGSAQGVGLVLAPILGGALIDAFSWRACFAMNIPLGVIVVAAMWWGLQDPAPNEIGSLTFKEIVRKVDLLGTLLVVPSIVCLLLAIQWGGNRYGWNDSRIVVLFVLFAVTFSIFAWIQHKKQEDATLPPHILKNRSVLAASWFSACCNGTLAVTEYYISVYLQGVKGYTATKSGLTGVPMLVGLIAGGLPSGMATSWVGYVNPFMFATSILAPIASGLLTTLDPTAGNAKLIGCMAFLGVAIGIGIVCPQNLISTALPDKDIPIGISIVGFGGGVGSSMFIAASSALFQNRLVDEISSRSPGINITQIENAGLSKIRDVVGSERLGDVLMGYDDAVTKTLYLPLALTCATIIGSALVKWAPIKKKKE